MTCEHGRLYLHAYLDDELGVADAIRFEQHLAECDECRKEQRRCLALRSALRAANLRFDPAPALAQRVNTAVRRTTKVVSSRQWMAVAASIFVVLGLASLLLIRIGNNSQPALMAHAVVDGHVRSLQANHLVDVPSSDHHTVKPWFQGKLDFSPPVPDLSAEGWVLDGGRLDYIDGKTVAALVYHRRKHQINVFIWPSQDSSQSVEADTLEGYHILHWSKSGMTNWVTSDLNQAELRQFAELFRQRE